VGIGIPRDAFLEQRGQPVDEFTTEMVRPLVEKAALVPAINAAWLLCGVLTLVVLVAVLWVRRVDRDRPAGLH
jgi:DHA2 family multidrug resistance protein